MSKIILAGLKDDRLLRNSEAFLGDEHEIVAYYDVEPVSPDILKGRNVFSLEQLKELQFDYIVFASFDAAHQAEMTKRLRSVGCNQPTIIERIFLPRAPEKRQEDKVRLIDLCQDECYGVIMGLSHALTGIDKSKLARKFFDLSWRGQDMYYNFRLFQYALEHGKFTDIKQAWLVFPQYYFDYDQSQSFKQFTSGQMFGSHRLDDWHNVERIKVGKYLAWIKNQIVNYRLFGRKFADYRKYRTPMHLMKVYSMPDGQGVLPKGFWTDRPATVASNRVIFRELIKLLSARHLKTTIILPPLFIDGLNEETANQLKVIDERFKSIAREELNNLGVDVEIKDYAGIFADKRPFFRDTEHVNYPGAVAFAQFLNGELLTE